MKNRLNEFLHTSHQPPLVLDASAGLSLGALAGLEDFARAIHPVLALVSGLVCSPGQISKLGPLTQENAGLLVRMDWNNTLRKPGFVLPLQNPQRIPILSAEDALDMGACGMVTTILLGYEEEVEAASILSMVQLALKGKNLGLPLVAEVLPTGPRVSIFGKAVELGASYALEGGADVIVVPHPGLDSLKTLGKFISVPWLVKPTSLQSAAAELEAARSAGAAGLWLDHSVFALADARAYLAGLQAESSPLSPSGEGAGK